MRTKKFIISIDGGGIRGIIPLVLLRAIQNKIITDLRSFNPDWWGTSTGALISSGIVVQDEPDFNDAVQNILDLYEFRAKFAVQQGADHSPSKAFQHLIDANFGTVNLENLDNLNIIASEKESLNPVIFNQSNPTILAEAVKASCAFPGLFPAVKIKDDFYVDGFYKAKNPSRLSLSKYQESDDLIILSLGTGVLPINDPAEIIANQDLNHLNELHKAGSIKHFRMNPELIFANAAMQNATAKNILNLRKDAQRFVHNNPKLIDDFLSALTA